VENPSTFGNLLALRGDLPLGSGNNSTKCEWNRSLSVFSFYAAKVAIFRRALVWTLEKHSVQTLSTRVTRQVCEKIEAVHSSQNALKLVMGVLKSGWSAVGEFLQKNQTRVPSVTFIFTQRADKKLSWKIQYTHLSNFKHKQMEICFKTLNRGTLLESFFGTKFGKSDWRFPLTLFLSQRKFLWHVTWVWVSAF
jgi:hypothetical protein